ncbi:hypothetical protein GCM10022409_14200 [Hymenobacter glaciei]|uniref:Secretion system C-terminal sorting domain-containing protein n=1 Tax=Hymenobacter glaciei TaxID=877209 RepID=A0ABP7TTK2_9BACT
MKALYFLALGIFGQFAAVAAPTLYTSSYTVQLTGQRYYAYPAAQVCNSDFAQSDDERTLPTALGGGGGWNAGNQSFTSTAIPNNMSVKSVSVTLHFSTDVTAPITLKLNGTPAETIWSEAGILRDGCQTATFQFPTTAYVDGGVNTVNVTVGANAVVAVSSEITTITYSVGKGSNGDTHGALVQVCHKGSPIYVAASAVAAHIGHGDSQGDCTTPATAKATPAVATELSVSPNPATDQVAFSFRTAGPGKTQLQVYNQWGKLVATVYNKNSEAGELNVVPFNSQQLPEGLYLCRLVSNFGVQTTRLTVSK